MTIENFSIDVSGTVLADLSRRLDSTRWPDERRPLLLGENVMTVGGTVITAGGRGRRSTTCPTIGSRSTTCAFWKRPPNRGKSLPEGGPPASSKSIVRR